MTSSDRNGEGRSATPGLQRLLDGSAPEPIKQALWDIVAKQEAHLAAAASGEDVYILPEVLLALTHLLDIAGDLALDLLRALRGQELLDRIRGVSMSVRDMPNP